jgi:uncharacterized membrane protein YkvA (DUF1232 family)
MTRAGDLARRLRHWAKGRKAELQALYFAARHPRTPWYVKVLAILVVGYAFSPYDLIPDPIPVLGYLDDLVLLPLGIWIAVKLIPADIWAECRAKALASASTARPVSRVAAVVIVLLWGVAFVLVARALWPWISASR